MYFNPTKSIHLSINAKVSTEYRIARSDIMTRSVHKDLEEYLVDLLLKVIWSVILKEEEGKKYFVKFKYIL